MQVGLQGMYNFLQLTKLFFQYLRIFLLTLSSWLDKYLIQWFSNFFIPLLQSQTQSILQQNNKT